MVEVRQVCLFVNRKSDMRLACTDVSSQDLLRASRDQPWSDVKELNWGAVNQDAEGREQNNGDLKSPIEHCQFAFLAHVEGWAYSGRLKYVTSLSTQCRSITRSRYLQQCRSVIVTHPLRYIQHYHHLLNPDPSSPNQNIVEVPLPLEEHLPGVMDGLLDPSNGEKVERIAENSWRDMRERWISPAAKYVIVLLSCVARSVASSRG